MLKCYILVDFKQWWSIKQNTKIILPSLCEEVQISADYNSNLIKFGLPVDVSALRPCSGKVDRASPYRTDLILQSLSEIHR